MTSLSINRYGLSVCVAAAMLAGCSGGSGTPLSPPAAGSTTERTRSGVGYHILYSFAGSGKGDGETPEAILINVKGTLYGTTILGGKSGDGTVFSITPSGTESVIHSFGGSGDGAYPEASLLDVKGTLYGTTMEGGAHNYGTVFSVTPSGGEKVLHSFGASRDGIYPVAGLIDVNGTFYGTTGGGGAKGDGTVFSITPSGTEAVVYNFKGGSADGENPYGSLLDVNGTFYSTTYEGGASNDGTVFSVTPSGKEKVLHTFVGGEADGSDPVTGLINVNGMLYGTTLDGGPYCSPSKDCGTVFAISPTGKEAMLHGFGGPGDGQVPRAGLASVKDTLYGTTEFGGVNCRLGCGIVFSVTPSGQESVLHNFGGSEDDGGYPEAGLLNVKGTFYGTTSGGGASNFGTVFSLKQ